MNTQEYIVAFHIGRGGKFNNQGYKSFLPYVSKLNDCFSETSIIISEDEDGNELPDEEWKLIDGGGNTILQGRESIVSDTGILDWDGEYDTDIVKYLDDCSDEELEIIYKAYINDEYMPCELKDYICEAMGLHRIDSIKFYKTNANILCSDCSFTFFWDGGYSVTKEDAAEWMMEQNIEPRSIEKYADDFEIHYYVSEEDE